eukprot:TRINITY_DN409_c2_g1_i1.p1 TRINITY_DN409_c2_g1~~TRINITY_DN409_c2_g1_i1.p1  ORF type:complete len:178 (-),score=52.03 TRINITY_DN409_c2_g1_i1:80-613(-)
MEIGLAVLGGAVAGYFLTTLNLKKHTAELKANNERDIPVRTNSDTDDDDDDDEYDSDYEGEEYKLVLVVRNDLAMGKGKIASQCSHATLGAYKKAQKKDKQALKYWEICGQAKVVVKVQSESDLLELQESAKKEKVNSYLVLDAGKTQIESGSATVLAVGPSTHALVNRITGHLKLL